MLAKVKKKNAAVVVEALIKQSQELPGAQQFEVLEVVVDRWRYALAREPLNQGAFWFGSKRLAMAGDWCYGSKVEGAFLSGVAAALVSTSNS